MKEYFSTDEPKKPEEPEAQAPEQAPEQEKEKEPIDLVYEDFQKNFNVKKEELENIEDFRELDDAQKGLVLENLKQLALANIQKGAIEKFGKEKEEAEWFKRMGMNAFKRFYMAGSEKKVAAETLHGGMAKHGELIREISKNVLDSNLDVEWNHDIFIDKKTLSINYSGYFENWEKLSEEEREQVQDFNKLANKMANAGTEWVYGDNRKLEKLKEKYEAARANVLSIKEKEFGSKENAAWAVAEMDRKMSMNQWLNASPNATKELDKMESQSVWIRALKNTIAERGSYMAMGYAGRTLLTGALGVLGAPLVAAGMGGWIARRRAIENLKEDAMVATRGGEQKMIREGILEFKDKEGKILKSEKRKVELLNVVDAKNLFKNMNRLTSQILDAKTEEEKTKLLQLLNTRILYTRAKVDKGLVNFGEGKEKLSNQYMLAMRLAGAETAYRMNQSNVKTAIEERLESFLGFKKSKIESQVRKEMARGMAMGAGFALLGAAIREIFGSVSPIRGSVEKTPSTGSTELKHLLEEVAKADKPSESLDTLTKMGVSASSLHENISVDTVKSLLKAGATPDSLAKFGVSPDTLAKVGVPADTLHALVAETAKMEKIPSDGVLRVLREKFSVFAKDSTFHVDKAGVITRQGWPGTYSIDKNGDMVFSGGTGTDGKEYAAQILKAGSKTEEQWVEAPPEAGIKPEQLELASIKKGEGAWHAVRRQLEKQFKHDPAKFGLKPEDLKDSAKLRLALNKETARILVENKILKSGGAEVRIRDIGTKVILRDGNKIEISGGKTYDWHPSKAKEEFNIPLKGLRDTQWIDNQRTFLLGKPSLLEKAGVNRWLVSDAADTYKGAVGEIINADHVRGLSALEQENLLATARHGASQLDQWGLKSGTGGSFSSHFDSVLKTSGVNELTQKNFEIYNDISKRVSSASGIEWAKAGKMRVSDMMRWSREPELELKPGAFRLVEAVSKLKPTRYEQTLTLDEFLKNNIRNGKSDFLKVLESTPKVPVENAAILREKLNSLVHGLVRENLTELKVNIPRYATVLGVKSEDVEHAFTELSKRKNIVGDLFVLAVEHPEQIRLLSKVFEAEPELKPEVQALKEAIDKMIGLKK